MSKIVVEEVKLTRRVDHGGGYYTMALSGFTKLRAFRPGQFVHVRIPHSDVYFRRAFSVYDIDFKAGTFSIIFKVFGRGTSLMAGMKAGDILDILGPLGNGFKLPTKRDNSILVAGGIGMPPIYLLAGRMIEKGYDPERILFFYGGTTRSDLVDLAKIKKLGCRVIASTDDGSYGFKGLVTAAMENELDLSSRKYKVYACGPEGMLRAVGSLAGKYGLSGQMSLEAPMPCGVGICLGCILPLREGGYTRVCRDGPVYNLDEVVL